MFIASCGFHLKGNHEAANKLPPLYLSGYDLAQVEVIDKEMRQAGVTVVGERNRAKLILTLISESRDRRVLSVNTAGKAQEYELQFRLRFKVEDQIGAVKLAEQEVKLVRDFVFSSDDILAKESEAEGLYRVMTREAAHLILARLTAQIAEKKP